MEEVLEKVVIPDSDYDANYAAMSEIQILNLIINFMFSYSYH